MEIFIFILCVGAVLAWIYFWIFLLADVMRKSSDEFPGPYEKCLWVAIFLMVAPLAPLVYIACRFPRRRGRPSQRKAAITAGRKTMKTGDTEPTREDIDRALKAQACTPVGDEDAAASAETFGGDE